MLKKLFGISSKKKKEEQETQGNISNPSSPHKTQEWSTSCTSSPKMVKNSSTSNRSSFSSSKRSKDNATTNPPSADKKGEQPPKEEKELRTPITVHEDPFFVGSTKRSNSGFVSPCNPHIVKKSGEHQVAGQVSGSALSGRHSTKSPLPEAQGSTSGTTRGPQLSASPVSQLESSGGMNVWRLPWQQPRVVTCQYCNRPRRPPDHALVSKEKKCAGDDEDKESDMSSTSSEEFSDGAAGGVTYCKCPHSPCAAEPEDDHEPILPVYIVETSRCDSMPGFLPLTVNVDLDDDEDINDGPTKLSLVSPLTCHTLHKSKSGRLSTDRSHATISGNHKSDFHEADERRPKEVACSISAWLENQEMHASGEAVEGK